MNASYSGLCAILKKIAAFGSAYKELATVLNGPTLEFIRTLIPCR